jgi:hypothetical protein
MSLEQCASINSSLARALDLLNSNETKAAIDIAIHEYKAEFDQYDNTDSFVKSKSDYEIARPAFSFLSSLLSSLGPRHPDTIAALALLRAGRDEATPFKPRVIAKRHGGYPVRLNNGKWTWQGPHWSRPNNRTWKTGYSSDFTFGQGK